jgi:hypothetical protein
MMKSGGGVDLAVHPTSLPGTAQLHCIHVADSALVYRRVWPLKALGERISWIRYGTLRLRWPFSWQALIDSESAYRPMTNFRAFRVMLGL